MRQLVLWVAPLGGRNLADGKHLAGWATRRGRTPLRVPTAADLTKEAIPAAAAMFDIMVRDALANDPELQVVGLGASQGCQAIGEALSQWCELPPEDRPDPARVSLILTGNLERRHFGYIARRPRWVFWGPKRLTPEATPYPVLDIGRKDDKWANADGKFSLFGPLINIDHVDYSKVDPDNLNVLSVKKAGRTTYVNVP